MKKTLGNYENLLNLFLVMLLMFAAFGCSGFVDGFKKGYDAGRNTTLNSPTTSSSPATGTRSRDDIKHILGSWVGRSYDNSKKVEFYFEDGGAGRGTATTKIDGVVAGKENYQIIDDKTVEFETNQGMHYRVTFQLSNDGEKLTMITAQGITTTFQRQ